MTRILLVEDNEELAAGIRHNLELDGYDVDVALDGEAGLDHVEKTLPDLIILDIMLPGMDGFQVLKTLRGNGFGGPILVLTARGDEADKVRGFQLHADQYLTKPFALLEFLERVRSLLARSAARKTQPDQEIVIQFGKVTVDPQARTVTRAGEPVSLTPKAFELLVALWDKQNKVVSRAELLRTVWGHRADVLTRTVDSYVSELRQKLEDDPAVPRFIHTVWKVGYRFTV